jgi:hypothetical protein
MAASARERRNRRLEQRCLAPTVSIFRIGFSGRRKRLKQRLWPESRFLQAPSFVAHPKEIQAKPMKNLYPTPSALEPRLETSQSSNDQFKIAYWCGKYEGHLFQTSPAATYERYSRCLSKSISHFPQKRFTYDFLMADFEDYKKARLKEGASGTTINIELSILRGFWRFMLKMDSPGVMVNPVRDVRVKVPSKKHKQVKQPSERSNTASSATSSEAF